MARGLFERYKAAETALDSDARAAREAADEVRKVEAHAAKMKETAAKMPYKMSKGLKRGLLAAGGLAAGGAGIASYLTHRRNKEEESMMKESASPKTIAMLLGAGAAAGAGSTIGAKHLINTYIKSPEQRELEAAVTQAEKYPTNGMESLGACKKSSAKLAMDVFSKLAVSAQMASRALSNMEKKTIGEGIFAQHAKNPRTVAKSLEGEGVEFPHRTVANMKAKAKPMAKAAADGEDSRWSNRQAGGLASLSAMLGGGAGYGITRGIVDPVNKLLENIQPVDKYPGMAKILGHGNPGILAQDVVRLPGSKLKALGAGAGAVAGLLTAGKLNKMMREVTPEQNAEMLAQYNANR